ncbi:MAG: UPF0280 family protein [Candidatus Micrarchaeota archaeon]
MLKGKRLVFMDSNLYVQCDDEKYFNTAYDSLLKHRAEIEGYIAREPFFLSSLEPVEVRRVPRIVEEMARAAKTAGVGPMAAVAGALADCVLGDMARAGAKSVVVENGGDIAISVREKIKISIYAGKSPLSGKIGFEVSPADCPIGICTSSGTVGHSLSFGDADAAVAVARSACVADAAATAIGNIVQGEGSLPDAVSFAKKLKIRGALIIKNKKIAAWGALPRIVGTRGLPTHFYKEVLQK